MIEAAKYYEKRLDGLGSQFLEEVCGEALDRSQLTGVYDGLSCR